MNEKALKILEYDKIIARLVNAAASEPGRELCRRLSPSDDLAEIKRRQRETSDAVSRLSRKGSVSFSGLSDIRASLKRLEVGASLNMEELLRVAGLLNTALRVKSWAKTEANEKEDSLTELFSALEPLTALANEIRVSIVSEDELSDDASPGLRQLRRQMRLVNERIRSQLNSLLNGPSRTYLQDSVITQRDGRYCVPVKAEYRNQVAGMIHDQSSSGSTVFVEPTAVVKLNNDLRELEIDEQKEIEKVLAKLSAHVEEHAEAIQNDLRLLAELDFIFARAQLSLSYKGTEPEFNCEGKIRIKKGRHPLLDPRKVVPVDIRLGEDFSMLIISGPNTGGKTVSLKTVGLLTLMGQAGLQIPAEEHSKLAVFSEVFADIGDEQSIEQSLSTFSSHMTNIVSFWEQADEHALLLFDELGAGTDPTEGAALAISILSSLHRRDIRTIATTHYSELKVYALSTPGVENASCEFDVETLRPTYRLLIGVPGKSNAFAISERLGLADAVIAEAKEQLSQQEEDFEDVIASLENSRKELERRQEALSRSEEELGKLKRQLDDREEKLEERQEAILENARTEAQALLRDTKAYADETIRKFNKLGRTSDSSRQMEQERSRLREKMSDLDRESSGGPAKKAGKTPLAKDLMVGDAVRVLSMNLNGTVSTLPDAKGKLYVQMGILRSQVDLSDIEKIEEKPACHKAASKSPSGVSALKTDKSASISAEINLIGKTADEAITALDKYLDDARVAHLSQVRIVHGKGSGVLRKAVHQYLRRQKHVASFRLGEYGEGDSGVTIVELN